MAIAFDANLGTGATHGHLGYTPVVGGSTRGGSTDDCERNGTSAASKPVAGQLSEHHCFCRTGRPTQFHVLQRGYFEAKMRWDTVRGHGPAFRLLSTRGSPSPPHPNISIRIVRPTRCLPLSVGVLNSTCWKLSATSSTAAHGPTTAFRGTTPQHRGGLYGQADQIRGVLQGTDLEMEEGTSTRRCGRRLS